MNTNPSVLLVIDFINEIVHERGKLAAKGYAAFIRERGTFDRLNRAIGTFRDASRPIIFVRLAFDPSYADCPAGSPLFSKAQELSILADGTWSTAIHEAVDCRSGDRVIVKKRVGAFHDTGLAESLRAAGVADVWLAGVATDLAVESTARSAHDLDFGVTVVADACAAANAEDHEKSLRFLPKIARVISSSDARF